MAVALKNRPVLAFRMPEGIKMATWDGGGGRIDAFKPDQQPGVSQGTIGGGETSDDMAVSAGGPGVGIDSGVGGLY